MIRQHSFDASFYRFHLCAGEDITPAFDGFWALSDISQCDIRDLEDTALFLHRAAVGEDTESIALHRDERDKAGRIYEANIAVGQFDNELGNFLPGVGVQAQDEG